MKFLKNVSGLSTAALIVAAPEPEIPIPAPKHANPVERPAPTAIRPLLIIL